MSRLLKPKSSSVTTLAKAVTRIQRQLKRKTILLNYGQQFNKDLSQDVDIFKLSNYSAWNRIFGTSSDDEDGNKMIHKSFGMDMYFNSSSEPNQINFSVFLVSLKDDMRGAGFSNTTGNLSLSSGFDYYATDGLTLINKKNFNIHGSRRFTLGNNGTGLGSSGAQTQYGTDRRIYMKMSCNKTVTNSTGNWKALDCSPDPSDNLYLLVFNDNAILDAEWPKVRINIVHTVEQLA